MRAETLRAETLRRGEQRRMRFLRTREETLANLVHRGNLGDLDQGEDEGCEQIPSDNLAYLGFK